MPKVTPILATQVNWGTFIESAKRYTGVSPTRCLDDSNIELQDAGALVHTMNDLLNQGRVPRLGCPALRYVSYGFLIEASWDAVSTLMDDTDLDVTRLSGDRHTACVATGTLQQWLMAFLGLQDYHISDYRQAMNQCQSYLEQSKVIRGILDTRSKLYSVDGTYTLRG